MTPEDESPSTDDSADDQAAQVPESEPDQSGSEASGELLSETSNEGAPVADPDTVEVDTSHLERAEEAIDEAREAVQKVAATDSIDEEATGAGDLPAFADSTADADQPAPPEDDTAPADADAAVDDAGDDDSDDAGDPDSR